MSASYDDSIPMQSIRTTIKAKPCKEQWMQLPVDVQEPVLSNTEQERYETPSETQEEWMDPWVDDVYSMELDDETTCVDDTPAPATATEVERPWPPVGHRIADPMDLERARGFAGRRSIWNGERFELFVLGADFPDF
jgi:hypothetical protein